MSEFIAPPMMAKLGAKLSSVGGVNAMKRAADAPIHGFVAPGFEAVRDAFARNFQGKGELGAAVAAYRRGEKVVDLWGGWREPERREPWDEDTLVLLFSTTKGMAALAVALAHARGYLDYDAPVAAYWPEFAQGGKDAVTVRQLLAHQAGLCVVDEPLDPAIIADADRLDALLARQKPAWRPGDRHGYHVLSLGWHEDALMRRVDPRGRSLPRFFAEEVAAPLGLDIHIGLPAGFPERRVAELLDLSLLRAAFEGDPAYWRLGLRFVNPFGLPARAAFNPRLASPGAFASPAYRHLTVPAAVGFATARCLAKAYDAFLRPGGPLALDSKCLAALAAAPVAPRLSARDAFFGRETAYALGFMKPSRDFAFSSGSAAFGSPGTGGSFAFADPDLDVAWAYVPNRLGCRMWDDPREVALRQAFLRCVEEYG